VSARDGRRTLSRSAELWDAEFFAFFVPSRILITLIIDENFVDLRKRICFYTRLTVQSMKKCTYIISYFVFFSRIRPNGKFGLRVRDFIRISFFRSPRKITERKFISIELFELKTNVAFRLSV